MVKQRSETGPKGEKVKQRRYSISLMVIDEGQQYGTDREIATISLLRTQPLILWTGDAQQTPGGLARAVPNAKRSRQLLLAKQHGLRSRQPWQKLW